ncbi:unnamed protein product [Blepharisma stoltei]|uniref:Uncharacterized protein n=1 Tax=Blepharisma stoltei TaxID=1481888 RepID=A0AAU9KBJ2_9CILI|nr:unnamed protein product [Blepharisma stoltei]
MELNEEVEEKEEILEAPKFTVLDIENLNLTSLTHPNIEKNTDFLFLKTQLQRYYGDRKLPYNKQMMHKNHSPSWKERLYHSLYNLLNEMVFTRDPILQLKLLDDVKNWYLKKVRNFLPGIKKIGKNELDAESTETSSFTAYNRSTTNQSFETPRLDYSLSPVSGAKTPVMPKPIHWQSKWIYKKKPTIRLIGWEKQKFIPEPVTVERSKLADLEIDKARTEKAFALKQSRFYKNPGNEDPESDTEKNEIRSKSTKPAEHYDFRMIGNMNSGSVSPGIRPSNFETQNANSSPSIRSKTEHLFTPDKLDELAKQRIEEIMMTKMKLASKKVSCQYDYLESGLFLNDFDLSAQNTTPFYIPKGNEHLLTNTGMKDVISKKKKKKKKKKKSKAN